MLKLRYDTPHKPYQQAVMGHFVTFLQDHAANERKVSQASMQLVAQYPQHRDLVLQLTDVAEEELQHFKQVLAVLNEQGHGLAPDLPDPYMKEMYKLLRKPNFNIYLLDRLLAFAIVEARGCERFHLVAEALPKGSMKDFYADLTRSEARHHALYLRLAKQYFPAAEVEARLDELLDAEAQITQALPYRAALH